MAGGDKKVLARRSSDSCGLPAVPDLRSVEAWQEPATKPQASTAISAVLAIINPDATDAHAAKLADLIHRRGYTQAELAYAVRELPYDPVLDKKLQFDQEITAADFERWIAEFRSMRAQLTLALRLDDVNRLIEKHPNWLAWDDFGICGYTAAETPLYRYCYSGAISEREPRPHLEEKEVQDPEREGGTYTIAELVEKEVEK